MNFSGLLVTASTTHLDAVATTLSGWPGLEVTHRDPAAGRLVVVQEAVDVAAEMSGFGRVRALPHVVGVDLVCHVIDADIGERRDHAAPTPVERPVSPERTEP